MGQLGEPSPHRCQFSLLGKAQPEGESWVVLACGSDITEQQGASILLPCFASAFETRGKGRGEHVEHSQGSTITRVRSAALLLPNRPCADRGEATGTK